jgi:hypothetical protein
MYERNTTRASKAREIGARTCREESWRRRLERSGHRYAQAFVTDDGRGVLVLNTHLELETVVCLLELEANARRSGT